MKNFLRISFKLEKLDHFQIQKPFLMWSVRENTYLDIIWGRIQVPESFCSVSHIFSPSFSVIYMCAISLRLTKIIFFFWQTCFHVQSSLCHSQRVPAEIRLNIKFSLYMKIHRSPEFFILSNIKINIISTSILCQV